MVAEPGVLGSPCPDGHAAGSCNYGVATWSTTLQAAVACTGGALGSTFRRCSELAALHRRPEPWHV
eukprot:14771210-Alexandrium_andersonii.AAC.2